MQELFFMARHIPFWAIPLVLISGEFAYLFWLRKKKKLALFCLLLCFLGLGCNVFYIYAGGPEHSVKIIKRMTQSLKK